MEPPAQQGVLLFFLARMGRLSRLQAAYRPRDVAKQREPVINQNCRSRQVLGRLCRSAVWGASIWGTEGREFKSPQPDKETAVQPVFPG